MRNKETCSNLDFFCKWTKKYLLLTEFEDHTESCGTRFFPIDFRAQARSAQAINRKEKKRSFRNLRFGPRTQLERDIILLKVANQTTYVHMSVVWRIKLRMIFKGERHSKKRFFFLSSPVEKVYIELSYSPKFQHRKCKLSPPKNGLQGKVCIRAKWPIRPKLILFSVTWSDCEYFSAAWFHTWKLSCSSPSCSNRSDRDPKKRLRFHNLPFRNKTLAEKWLLTASLDRLLISKAICKELLFFFPFSANNAV